MSEGDSIRDVAKGTLSQVQTFDSEMLAQNDRLGQVFDFTEAVPLADRIVSLFRRLPVESLEIFPENEVQQTKSQSSTVLDIFEEILNFDPTAPEAANKRVQLLKSLRNQHQQSFSKLAPLIAFSHSETADLSKFAAQGRATIDGVQKDAERFLLEIASTAEDAKRALGEVRNAAAEKGVSQQATYFKDEADKHNDQSGTWLGASITVGIVLLIYSVVSLFFPQFNFLTGDSLAEAIQLAVSKILIFAVLSYSLFQCVRNFSAHRHNEVSNRHRQNALMTYRALYEAGGTEETRDIVLQHASAAVFSPGDSGYLKNEDRGPSGNGVFGVSARPGASISPSSE